MFRASVSHGNTEIGDPKLVNDIFERQLQVTDASALPVCRPTVRSYGAEEIPMRVEGGRLEIHRPDPDAASLQ